MAASVALTGPIQARLAATTAICASSAAFLAITKETITERTDRTDDCPYSGDPIEATGSPELIRPDTALGSLVLFLTAMYFSYKGLKRRRFVLQNAICWLLAGVGGCVCFQAVASIILHFVWPWT